jgi:hypothetical protein
MTRECLGQLIYQGKTNEVMECLKAECEPPRSKMEIWLTIENHNYSAIKLYKKFYEVLHLLDPKADKNRDGIILERTPILVQSITTMLEEVFQANIRQEISKNSYKFLQEVVPTYLEEKSTHLLFERLWKILEMIRLKEGLDENQICCAWAVCLYYPNF